MESPESYLQQEPLELQKFHFSESGRQLEKKPGRTSHPAKQNPIATPAFLSRFSNHLRTNRIEASAAEEPARLLICTTGNRSLLPGLFALEQETSLILSR